VGSIRAWTVILLLAVALAVVLAATGCENPEAVDQRFGDAGLLSEAEAASAFRAEVTLCRRVSRKSGEPIGAGHEFVMSTKSRVHALVDLANVRTDRVYSVHLVWIAPSGREIFRKYAEVTLRPDDEGGYDTLVHWRDAEDLNSVKEELRHGEKAAFRLRASFTTSLDRQRAPGTYAFRLYLDRRLLAEERFTLTADSAAGPPTENQN